MKVNDIKVELTPVGTKMKEMSQLFLLPVNESVTENHRNNEIIMLQVSATHGV